MRPNKYRSPETETPQGSEAPQDTNQTPTPPSAPAINDEDKAYRERLERALAEQTQRFNELNSKFDQLTRRPEPERHIDPDKEREDYMNNPPLATRKLVQEELERTIKPLNEFVSGFRSQETVRNWINSLRSDSRFAPYWDQNLENAIANQLSTLPAAQINQQVAIQAAVAAIGLRTLGAIPAITPANPQPSNNNQPSNMQLPNVRPSNPPAPRDVARDKEPELTENELRMQREQGMTKKEFVFWRDLPADKVMTATWDKATQTGKY